MGYVNNTFSYHSKSSASESLYYPILYNNIVYHTVNVFLKLSLDLSLTTKVAIKASLS